MQTAYWQLWFPIVLRELGTRHASPPRFDPVESGAPPNSCGYLLYNSLVGCFRFYLTTRPSYNRSMRIRGEAVRILFLPALLLWAVAAYGGDMTKLNIQI